MRALVVLLVPVVLAALAAGAAPGSAPVADLALRGDPATRLDPAPRAGVLHGDGVGVRPPVARAVVDAPGARRGAVPPVDGPVVRRFDPPATPYGPGHRGVDLAAPPGTAVRAALPGVVAFAGPVAGRGWVTIDHGGGLDTTYGWIEPRTVVAGQRLRAGASIGALAGDAAHLDWGARRDGAYIDPLSLLGPWRARLVPLP
jgi:murein DD-endopeptidase MepM/ murein hydrolase activator NlpD